MASITLGGNPIQTSGELPKVGSKLIDFKLIKNDLSIASLNDFAGKKFAFWIGEPICIRKTQSIKAPSQLFAFLFALLKLAYIKKARNNVGPIRKASNVGFIIIKEVKNNNLMHEIEVRAKNNTQKIRFKRLP